jgi:pilus assembly protein CpaB
LALFASSEVEMSSKRLVTLVFALGCALMAAYLARHAIGSKPAEQQAEAPKVETVDVLVAAKDVQMGQKLGQGTVAWRSWPKDSVDPNFITRDAKPDAMADLEKARARFTIYQGETILDKKLLRPGAGGFMSAMLPKGMRAISVAISSRSSAGGFILPDDRVDVILTRKIDAGGVQAVKSETVISNVRILAVNQIFKQAADGEPVTVDNGQTATLELEPRQAEIVEQVQSTGELSLALRSIAESEGKSPDQITPQLADKYAGKGKQEGGETRFLRYGVESYAANQ